MELKEALAALKKTNERLALREAKDYAGDKLAGERLNEATKKRLLERLVTMAPLTAEGTLDEKKFDEIIAREVKDEATYLAQVTGGRIVTGMGSGAPLRENLDGLSKKERKALRKQREAANEDFEDGMKEVAATLGLGKEGRKLFAIGRNDSEVA